MDGEKPLAFYLDAAANWLGGVGVDSPRATAEHLAARLLRCRRSEIPARISLALPPVLVEALRRGMKRVASGEPLQYVLGEWDFRGLTLKTDKRALVPRPETEQLVSLALASDSFRNASSPRVLDWGTGSGCIALSIAAEAKEARVVGLDISADALALATENAALLGLSDRVKFVDGSRTDIADVFDPASVDLVISNPPYIPSDAVDRLDRKVLDYEPRLALDGGPDGMEALRQVSEEAAMLLASGGALFLELDAESDQAAKMAPFLRDLGFSHIRPHRDLSGCERFLSGVMSDGV